MRISDWSSDVCSSDLGDKAFPARTDSSRSWHYLHSYRASLHRLSTGKLRSFTIPILSSVNRYAKSTVPLSAPPCDMLVGSNEGEVRAIERRDIEDRKSTRLNSSH